jgi:hypothetical protein
MRSPLAFAVSVIFLSSFLAGQGGSQTQHSSPRATPAASASSSTHIAPAPRVPTAMYQCEADQCTSPNGGGGALWLFEGRRGQALWRFAAIAS